MVHFVEAIGLLLLIIVLRVAYAIRHELFRRFKALLSAGMHGISVWFVLSHLFKTQTAIAVILGVVAGLVRYACYPERKRHIPHRVKRKVVWRHYMQTGQIYDPQKDHIDHIVPFARGGSHTADNLRVLPKITNLRKGKKLPSPGELFGLSRTFAVRRSRIVQVQEPFPERPFLTPDQNPPSE